MVKTKIVQLIIEAEFDEIPSEDILSEILQVISGSGYVRVAKLIIPQPHERDLTKIGLY